MMQEEDGDDRVELPKTTARRVFQSPANSAKVHDAKTHGIGSCLLNRGG